MKDADRRLKMVSDFAARLRGQRTERQQRRHLDPTDFDDLRKIGFHLAAVPEAYGGFWQSVPKSIRPMCEAIRTIATGDPSLALSLSMHPTVLAFWRDGKDPDPPDAGWEQQKKHVYATVVDDGAWWATVSSEPGSGGDIRKTSATARPVPGQKLDYNITGEKHFGSGSSIASYMITPAIPEGEAEPAWFFIDFRGIPWDGSTGILLRSEWDGHGMPATDSHAFTFRNVPATRLAWPGHQRDPRGGGAGVGLMFFTAVIVGVVDVAMNYIRQRMQQRGQQALRAFDRVELVMAEREAWLVLQAYEGGLRSLEKRGSGPFDAAMAKATIASLTESLLTRLCRLSGGGAYSRSSPLGYWANDVRALGFLRPPWALATDELFDLSWQRAMVLAPE